MNSDLLRKLVAAHFNGDELRYRQILLEVIREERRKRQTVLANELASFLPPSIGDQMQPELRPWRPTFPADVPKDKERGFPLLEVREPSRGLDRLILSSMLSKNFARIVNEYRQSENLRSHGLSPAKKILFFGAPGCGKTVAAEALAKELYLPFVLIRFDALISSYLGETASNLRKIFDYLEANPCVALFDEFDAIGKSRTSEDEHGEIKRVINSFLQIIDGFRSETILVAATNHEGLLDSALWRRFDKVLEFKPPGSGEIEKLIERLLLQFRISTKQSLPSIVKKLRGFSHADIERVIMDSVKSSILEGSDQLTISVIDEAIASLEQRYKQNKPQARNSSQSAKK